MSGVDVTHNEAPVKGGDSISTPTLGGKTFIFGGNPNVSQVFQPIPLLIIGLSVVLAIKFYKKRG